jgi:uncharacterized membrane protein YesL
MQILNFLADMMILNILYIICCIPIVTIGAAQAALHTGCKVLLDKEDDSSAIGAFFKAFISGFGKITVAWCIMTLVLAGGIYGTITAYMMGAPLWAVLPATLICAVFHTLLPIFHARFDCTVWQLIRNPWYLLFAHPLRSILSAVLLWAPVALLPYLTVFVPLTPIFLTLIYSTIFCLISSLMKKPIKVLIDHFNETHGNTPPTEELPQTEEETEEV